MSSQRRRWPYSWVLLQPHASSNHIATSGRGSLYLILAITSGAIFKQRKAYNLYQCLTDFYLVAAPRSRQGGTSPSSDRATRSQRSHHSARSQSNNHQAGMGVISLLPLCTVQPKPGSTGRMGNSPLGCNMPSPMPPFRVNIKSPWSMCSQKQTKPFLKTLWKACFCPSEERYLMTFHICLIP